MAQPTVTWLWNNTANDGANTGGASGGSGAGGSNWAVMVLADDRITFLDSQQQDGDPISGNRYGVIISPTQEVEAPKTFVSDLSLSVLDQVPLAGSSRGGGGNFRYPFCVHFGGPTASVPFLEAWDTIERNTSNDPYLGGGTPENSTIIAIATTNSSPGAADWGGTPLAGVSSRIQLDTGPLSGSKALYFNISHRIPAAFLPRISESLVLSTRYLFS